MRKHGNEDSLWLSGDVLAAIEDSSGFAPTGQEIDGLASYEWKPPPATP